MPATDSHGSQHGAGRPRHGVLPAVGCCRLKLPRCHLLAFTPSPWHICRYLPWDEIWQNYVSQQGNGMPWDLCVCNPCKSGLGAQCINSSFKGNWWLNTYRSQRKKPPSFSAPAPLSAQLIGVGVDEHCLLLKYQLWWKSELPRRNTASLQRCRFSIKSTEKETRQNLQGKISRQGNKPCATLQWSYPPPPRAKPEHMLHFKTSCKHTPNYEIITRNQHDKERRIIILTWDLQCTLRHHEAALLQPETAHSLLAAVQRVTSSL